MAAARAALATLAATRKNRFRTVSIPLQYTIHAATLQARYLVTFAPAAAVPDKPGWSCVLCYSLR